MTRKRKPARGGARVGAGRKPVGDGVRDRLVPLRVTQDEYDAVAAAVAAENARRESRGSEPVTVSSWFRFAGLNAARALRP